MKNVLLVCVAALSCLFFGATVAAPLATAERIQSPAWLVRDGLREPLAPGQNLRAGDSVETGVNARVYLRLAEGSQIKLGEHAVFVVESGAMRSVVLTGLMDVVNGAFRFTTGLVNKGRGRRDLRIQVMTATIGIRGTDVWGRAAGDGDLVALIEGNISLRQDGQALDIQPMQFMDAPRGAAARVKALAPATLERLAAETELQPGAGMRREPRAGWAILAGEFVAKREAQMSLNTLRDAGFPARVSFSGAGRQSGKPYRLLVSGFGNEAAAQAALAPMTVIPGLSPRVVSVP